MRDMDNNKQQNTGRGEIERVFHLFFDGPLTSYQTIDTSRDEADFRETILVETEAGGRFVIKLADNDFTFPEKIRMWQRTAEEYRSLGYYCPKIYGDKMGGFPLVDYGGRRCAAYAEDRAPYRSVADRVAGDGGKPDRSCWEAAWTMTAQIAAKHLDYTEYPSAYCLFEPFCPSDGTDEVLENALAWKKYAETLPDAFGEQVQRIWRLWTENRAALETVYRRLPTSVFQADLNPTNLLLDDDGRFVGVYDFNLCGRDVFLNYLMRENYGDFDEELRMIREVLTVVRREYRFSEAEKAAALPLYRCLKPLWYTKLLRLKEAGGDREAIRAYLDKTERALTEEVDFASYMG